MLRKTVINPFIAKTHEIIIKLMFGRGAPRSANEIIVRDIRSAWDSIRLGTIRDGEVRYYPGQPEGYVGYTDYTAMNVKVNDSLIGREPEEQAKFVGLGVGFSFEMVERSDKELISDTSTFHTIATSVEELAQLRWLATVQEKGTDNAPPSTRNLARVLKKVARELSETGPITLKYWHKVKTKTSESLENSDTGVEGLLNLQHILAESVRRGALLAKSASVATWKPTRLSDLEITDYDEE